jgi:cupin 2 domain-containing protein
MELVCHNIFTAIPEQLPEELFSEIVKRDNIHIERIVSQGHCTPAGQWFDQAEDEWVLLLTGQATLIFEQEPNPLHLIVGDYVLIPAHTRHRVEWTLPDVNTVWLALHFHA